MPVADLGDKLKIPTVKSKTKYNPTDNITEVRLVNTAEAWLHNQGCVKVVVTSLAYVKITWFALRRSLNPHKHTVVQTWLFDECQP
jgi:hypothetical protein